MEVHIGRHVGGGVTVNANVQQSVVVLPDVDAGKLEALLALLKSKGIKGG